MMNARHTGSRNHPARFVVVSAIVLALLFGGLGAVIYLTHGICDVTMLEPSAFLAAHDVVGVGVLERSTIVRRLGPLSVYHGTDMADPVVMRYQMRPIELVKGKMGTEISLWRVEAEGRRSTLPSRLIWRIGDTLVFYGEYPTGREDVRRLVSHGPGDSLLAAELRRTLSEEELLALSAPRGALIVEDDDHLWDLNYFGKFCYWNGSASRSTDTETYLSLLRSSMQR